MKLGEADLRGVDLQVAVIFESNLLNNAIYDGETKWPEGFDYRDAGARFLPRTE